MRADRRLHSCWARRSRRQRRHPLGRLHRPSSSPAPSDVASWTTARSLDMMRNRSSRRPDRTPAWRSQRSRGPPTPSRRQRLRNLRCLVRRRTGVRTSLVVRSYISLRSVSVRNISVSVRKTFEGSDLVRVGASAAWLRRPVFTGHLLVWSRLGRSLASTTTRFRMMGTMGRGNAATAARELESTRSGCDVPNVWAGQRRVFLSPSVEFAPRVRPWETSVESCQRDPTVVLGSFDALHGSGENSSSCTPSSQEGVQEPRYLCAKSPRPGTMRTYAGAPAGNDSPQGKRALRSPVVPPAQKLTAIPRTSAFADASSSQGSSSSTSSLLSRVYRSQCVHGEPDPDMVASWCVEGSARGGKRRRVCNASSMLCRQSALVSDSPKVAVSLGVCLSDRLDPAGRRPQHKWDHEPLDALRTRETGCLRGSALRCATLALRFRSMRLRQEYDANANNMSFKLPLLRRRASVVEIVAVDDVVFTLTANGICTAFKATTQKRLCCLNLSADEVVRSIFLNKANHALITVSVRHEDRFLRLRCRSTPIEAICRGRPECGFPLFTSECLSWPGFVEFDDVNSKVLTFSANDRSYTVWDLATYRRLYRIACRSIAEIKISPG
ncbi:hypothetical protein F1559_004115 [Cyanidiococcus yangmingshanensis]|uniref:Uncharacterized protein n=1 Tax=Cyanidiococcus yangmingshanensis TaxID=2690220 RepID=A0A7J7IG32_9RHOD|nr:hypothetical protein F1559_004115 [Cyanidiococcus yangmingshanensis]